MTTSISNKNWVKEKKAKPKKETNASRLGALSSYNPANAEEAGPTADKM